MSKICLIFLINAEWQRFAMPSIASAWTLNIFWNILIFFQWGLIEDVGLVVNISYCLYHLVLFLGQLGSFGKDFFICCASMLCNSKYISHKLIVLLDISLDLLAFLWINGILQVFKFEFWECFMNFLHLFLTLHYNASL